MIAPLALFWAGLPKWLQDTLKIVGLCILAVVVGKTIAEMLKAEGAHKQAEKDRVESMKEQARVTETRREIEETRSHDIEQAREAGRNLPPFGSADQLRHERPDIAGELFGDRENGSPERAGR